MSAAIVSELQGSDAPNLGSAQDLMASEACCPDAGTGDWEDMKEDIRQMFDGKVWKLFDAISEFAAPGSGDSQSSGIEQLSNINVPGNGEGSSTEALNGSDKLIEIGPGDIAGGGGTGVNPVSRTGGTLNKLMPHTIENSHRLHQALMCQIVQLCLLEMVICIRFLLSK